MNRFNTTTDRFARQSRDRRPIADEPESRSSVIAHRIIYLIAACVAVAFVLGLL